MVTRLEEIELLIDLYRYEEAKSLLKPLAAQGDSEAQNKLGEIHHFVDSDIRDYSKAKECYLKAVNKGNGEAANHLGRIYVNDEGV